MPFTVCAVTLPTPLMETLVVPGSTCQESVNGSPGGISVLFAL